ncbi:MAG TPA: DUF1499 domain-containing protein [Longimicrobiales bacterium]|nr:DUF1499 domain-containing protein [Longimicrobiales bacterium]
MKLSRRLSLGLTRNAAFTTPDSEDIRLRGRTYAIPFEDVWQASLHIINDELKWWTLLDEDDREGILRAQVRGRIGRLASGVTIRISLDVDAQTRVDALSASRVGRVDFGVNARRLGRFFQHLDRRLEAMRRAAEGA